MDQTKDKQIDGDGLRRSAEAFLSESSEAPQLTGTEDARKNFHELQVYQVELEMQNAELLQTRNNLEKMLERYNDLFDFAPMGYITLTREGTIRAANFIGASLLGLERSHLPGRRFELYLTEKSRSDFADFLDTVFTSTDIKLCEVMLLNNAPPKIIHIEARSDEAAQECRLALIDITEQKCTEQKLKESERIYRAIGESIDYGIWTCDPDGRNTYASESFLKMVDITQEQCSDFGWGSVLHPDDSDRTIETWKECVRAGYNWDREHRFRGADGSWHYVLARGVPVRDDQGKITCWAGINLDIGSIKRAEEALCKNEKKLSDVYASMSEGLVLHEIVYDNFGKAVDYLIIDVNPAFENITGLERSTAIGKKASELYGTGVAPYLDRYAEVASTGESTTFEVHFVPMNKHFRISVFSPEKGEFATIFQDITKRKQAEEALKQLNDELEVRVTQRTEELRQKDQMLILQDRFVVMGEMINNIAHQWRQPLNNLGLAIQQLPFTYDTTEFGKEYLEKHSAFAMEQICHMSETIEVFRNFFKPDKTKVTFGIIREICRTLSLVEGNLYDLNIKTSLQSEGDPQINGYPNEFTQVLLNILTNARDALLGNAVVNATISIKVFSEGKKAVVTITDNAGGINEEILGRIFDPFFTTKETDKGTGIGLFMSKTIIEEHMGGRLAVRNSTDGAEFRIEL